MRHHHNSAPEAPSATNTVLKMLFDAVRASRLVVGCLPAGGLPTAAPQDRTAGPGNGTETDRTLCGGFEGDWNSTFATLGDEHAGVSRKGGEGGNTA